MELKQIPKYNYRESLLNLKKISGTKQARSFAWLSLTIFTVSFFAVVAIRPTFITIAKLVKELNEKREANQKLEKKIKTLIAARDIFVNNSENISLLDQALPAKNEFPTLAYFFEEGAQSSSVLIVSLALEKIPVEKKDKADGSLLFSFSLNATGPYLNLKDYLSHLESSRRIIKIETSSFARVKRKDEAESITEPNELKSNIFLSVSGKVFFQPL